MNTIDQILEKIKQKGQTSAHELAYELNLSRVAIHRHLKKLTESGILLKIGTPPRVYYAYNTKPSINTSWPGEINSEAAEILQHNYIYITPDGHILEGIEAFAYWAELKNPRENKENLLNEYIRTYKAAQQYRSNEGWIDATHKFDELYNDKAIDTALYADFYSLPKFGKTKLGQMVLYAKQTQKTSLMKKIAQQVKPLISQVIDQYNITAVGFIPPTIPRPVQFLKVLKTELALSQPEIELVKIYRGEVPVPQKSLSTTQERIINARETIHIMRHFGTQNILLIDDAVGSGATFHEVALKCLQAGFVKGKIITFAIAGSLKGFEVIKEI